MAVSDKIYHAWAKRKWKEGKPLGILWWECNRLCGWNDAPIYLCTWPQNEPPNCPECRIPMLPYQPKINPAWSWLHEERKGGDILF